MERFNGFARSGVDGDFGRGNSAYDLGGLLTDADARVPREDGSTIGPALVFGFRAAKHMAQVPATAG